MGPSDQDRLQRAFRYVTSRYPSGSELEMLSSVLAKQKELYRDRIPEAEKLISQGESPVDTNLNPTELAAWTMLANLLLNLDETITLN